MAQLRKENELHRVRDTNDWGDETGTALKGYNAERPNLPNEPRQKIAGPGAAVGTPATIKINDGVNVAEGVWNLEGKETQGPGPKVQPSGPFKGTGKEESRIDKGYTTLSKGVKDGCTDM